MRAYQVIIAGLCLVIMILSFTQAWICYKVLTDGMLIMIEPDLRIIVSELTLSLIVMLGAAFMVFCQLRRCKDD